MVTGVTKHSTPCADSDAVVDGRWAKPDQTQPFRVSISFLHNAGSYASNQEKGTECGFPCDFQMSACRRASDPKPPVMLTRALVGLRGQPGRHTRT